MMGELRTKSLNCQLPESMYDLPFRTFITASWSNVVPTHAVAGFQDDQLKVSHAWKHCG